MTITTSMYGGTLIRIKYPGYDDPAYVARRSEIENITRSYQDGGLIPTVQYTDEEKSLWKLITTKLWEVQPETVCKEYMRGREALGLSPDEIPQLEDLNRITTKNGGFEIKPVEGWLDSRSFFAGLAERTFYCTQYLRYGAEPFYTPDVDIIHEVVGHLPTLVYDNEYTRFNELVGKAALKATDEEIAMLDKLYWFTIEFGLMKEDGKLCIYGGSPCGSVGENQNCLTDKVDQRPFDLEEVINTEYPIYGYQPVLFYIESFQDLLDKTEPFLSSIANR